MSWEAAQWAACLAYPGGGAPLKAVLSVIAGHANSKTNRCFLSMETIAAEAWCSIRAARDAVRELEKLGAISVTRSPGRTASTYEINLSWSPPNPAADAGLQPGQPGSRRRATRQPAPSNPAGAAAQQDTEQDTEHFTRGGAGAPDTLAGPAAPPQRSEPSPPVAAREHELTLRVRAPRTPAGREPHEPEAAKDPEPRAAKPPSLRRMQAPAETPPGERQARADEYAMLAKVETWRATGAWDEAADGPAPGQPGCCVPDELIGPPKLFDYQPTPPSLPRRTLLRQDILLLRDRSDTGLLGVPRLQRAAGAMAYAVSIQATAQSFSANVARPGGVLSTEGNISDDVASRVKGDWQMAFGPRSERGKTALLTGGLKWTPVLAMTAQRSTDELQLLVRQRLPRGNRLATVERPDGR